MDATQEIRALGFSNLIIGLTGNAMDEDVAAFLAAGVDIVFAKPMTMDYLNLLFAYVSVHGNGSIPGRKLRLVNGSIESYVY